MRITVKINRSFKMVNHNEHEVWFLTGSQHLYGEETLNQVAEDSKVVVRGLNKSKALSVKIKFKPVLTTPSAITALIKEANNSGKCVGLIAWMHTFSPAKMWINGLRILNKPLLHFHTQFNRDIPWSEIDMDFMNLNQSAHGGREFGFICSRMGISRKVITGHWKSENVRRKIDTWMRAALALREFRNLKIARFGDNMREVAVTEGNKVSAQIQLGISVNGYGIGDLVKYIDSVSEKEVNLLVKQYSELYEFAKNVKPGKKLYDNVKYQARIEIGIRRFLEEGGFGAFTTTFEDLHGLNQLPGLAVQRLMADGYGFGAEGDWKTAALIRAMKVMSAGLNGGTSFMEDYTYNFNPDRMCVLGAHMLEICPSIASGKPKLEAHKLSIGGKKAPARLVFDAASGPALNATLLDIGNRYRMLINKVDVLDLTEPMPKLPVARVLWEPKPNLETAATAWIYSGGAHHTAFTQALKVEQLIDFSEMLGIEFLVIDENTDPENFKKELRINEVYYSTVK